MTSEASASAWSLTTRVVGLGRSWPNTSARVWLPRCAPQDMLERVAKEKGLNYEEWVEGLKHKNQWHVEVY